jgi:hypothetical protein
MGSAREEEKLVSLFFLFRFSLSLAWLLSQRQIEWLLVGGGYLLPLRAAVSFLDKQRPSLTRGSYINAKELASK